MEMTTNKTPDEATIRADLAGRNGSTGFAIIGGTVSGNLEIFDFDLAGEFLLPGLPLSKPRPPGLLDGFSVQKTRAAAFILFHVARK